MGAKSIWEKRNSVVVSSCTRFTLKPADKKILYEGKGDRMNCFILDSKAFV